MAQGTILPQLQDNKATIAANKVQQHYKRQDHYFPPIQRLGQHQLVTISHPNNKLIINNNTINMNEYQDSNETDNSDAQEDNQVEGQKEKMFTQMSMEAQEAYNQTVREMSSNKSVKSNKRLDYIVNATDIQPRTDAQTASATTDRCVHAKNTTECSCGNSNMQQSLTLNGNTNNKGKQLPQLIPLQTSTGATMDSKCVKNPQSLSNREMQSVKTIISRAPKSHTAARIGRKKRFNRTNTDPMIASHDPEDFNYQMARPFEITPMGYDSRYMNVQNICDTQYNTDEDEDLASHVIDRATAKCTHWLNYQNDSS